jgi:hypothetical protein
MGRSRFETPANDPKVLQGSTNSLGLDSDNGMILASMAYLPANYQQMLDQDIDIM